ncbi:hypothetical protein BABINDRAFT_165892 [Babjeviella inositovora NRRL Y-12698]|uniref:Mediator of RNA polymerase II transcription subunit 13 n=1 Tax=Babjeviella inositovora NRRL Y-12698 TaxID=984486 RepID=A0A1E3QU21_9ASCO|nr:uncharacterized protein BABINDRAFT_165892 [Babjeviella inositovora NRRL Y-12698]ODQ81191.1 hypothetical protein BABINDRAFT_165892 [Babjeviella inositovora NRRL Y-12698]
MSTNYAKLARLAQVNYSIYTSAKADDQSVLEAELLLRSHTPNVLATYYAKELWVYSLNDTPLPAIPASYHLKFQSSGTIPPLKFFQKLAPPAELPNFQFIHLTFIKSVKKLVLTRLTLEKAVAPFGNHCVSLLPADRRCVVLIDPILTPQGDLYLNICSKEHHLRTFKELPSDSSDPEDVSERAYAIYLIPSGIRAHFADETLQESRAAPPANYAQLVQTLRLALALPLPLDPAQLTWVRLVPNLNHLNNLTPAICQFLQNGFANTKLVIWPLELCYVQGAVATAAMEMAEFSDPLRWVDDFSNWQQHTNTIRLEHLKFQSAVNTPMSTMATPMDAAALAMTLVPAPSTEEDWGNLSEELFGDDGMDEKVTEGDFNFFDEYPSGEAARDDTASEPRPEDVNDARTDAVTDTEPDAANDTHEDVVNNARVDANGEACADAVSAATNTARSVLSPVPLSPAPPSPALLDIPMDKMIQPPKTPGCYRDPGAPLPIESPNPPMRRQSAFSPLTFNPIIKSGVDAKYVNGGRFYVPEKMGLVTAISSDETGSDSDADSHSDGPETHAHTSTPSKRAREPEPNNNDDLVRGSPSAFAEPFDLKPTLGVSSTAALPNIDEKPVKRARGEGSLASTNWLPLLLRSINVFLIPDVFYTENPTIRFNELNDLLPVLADGLVWDDGFLGEAESCEFGAVSVGFREVFARCFASRGVELNELVGGGDGELWDFLGTSLDEVKPSLGEVPGETNGFPGKANGDQVTSPSPSPVPGFSPSPELTIFPGTVTGASSPSLIEYPQPSFKLKKLNQAVKIKPTGVQLWKYLGLNPLSGPKNLRILLVSLTATAAESRYFLSSVIQHYGHCKLGAISLVGDGILSIPAPSGETEYYELVGARLTELARTLQEEYVALPADAPEREQPIVLLFADFFGGARAVVETARLTKVFEFNVTLFHKKKDRLPIRVVQHVVPGDFFAQPETISVISAARLERFVLTMYNKIPGAPFATLLKTLPKSIAFRVGSHPKASLMSEDVYIHLAYERSIDKNWCVAVWLDQWGSSRLTKAWYCSPSLGKLGNPSTGLIKSFEDVSNDIWQETLRLTRGHGGNKFLVLTRLSNIIPDDELVQWRRLSSNNKNKDLSLIVMAVNPSLKTLVRAQRPDACVLGMPHTAYEDTDATLVDLADAVSGAVLRHPLALSNQQTRMALQTGLLMKPASDSDDMLVFELNLLSCSGSCSSTELLRAMMAQYRNLAALSAVWGVAREPSLVPWHVLAVQKCLRFLVHLRVEQ